MPLFKEMTMPEQAYLKAGAFGAAGTGKTHTAVSLAMGLHQWIGSEKPIAFLDTETGSDYQLHRFQQQGIRLHVAKTRAFKDLVEAIREARQLVDILLIDSLSHFWDELTRAYLRGKRDGTKFIRLQDWQPIKEQWRIGFAEPYVTSPLHIIWCARSANVFDDVEDTEASRQAGQTVYKTVKIGTKARSESEASYEPSLLIEMDRIYHDGNGQYVRRCQVVKDRWGVIDGKEFDDPTFDAFLPHVRLLNLGGPHRALDETRNSDALFTQGGNSTYLRKQAKMELLGELKGLYDSYVPGMGAKDKKMKADLAYAAFGKRGWEALEGLSLEELQTGFPVADYLMKHLDTLPDDLKEFPAWLEGQKAIYLASLTPTPTEEDDVPHFDGPDPATVTQTVTSPSPEGGDRADEGAFSLEAPETLHGSFAE